MEVDLVLLAMGFSGPTQTGLLEQLQIRIDRRGNIATDEKGLSSVSGVFAAGDMHTGQSLVVRAIADGRRAARAIDEYLV
jgi:glutamate synthase (NADPH/NADH) small chain